MAATLEQGIDAMQNNKASTQGEPHDPTETTILIQATQSQLAALASRLHSPANHMERNLRFNAITNCFGEFMTPLANWNQLPSPVQDTKPLHLLPLPALPERSWTDFLCLPLTEPNTGHSVYGTNEMSTWMERTAPTTPLDLETFLSLDLSTPPHVLSLLTTQAKI